MSRPKKNAVTPTKEERAKTDVRLSPRLKSVVRDFSVLFGIPQNAVFVMGLGLMHMRFSSLLEGRGSRAELLRLYREELDSALSVVRNEEGGPV